MEALQIAAGDGRITAEELDSRVEAALSARTLDDLAALTADLPTIESAAPPAREKLVIAQAGSKYEKAGRWVLPERIEIRTGMTKVTLDLTEAVVTSGVLRIDAEMAHGRLVLVTAPDMVVDADGLTSVYAKIKLAGPGPATPRLRVEVTGNLIHSKLIERRSRRP